MLLAYPGCVAKVLYELLTKQLEEMVICFSFKTKNAPSLEQTRIAESLPMQGSSCRAPTHAGRHRSLSHYKVVLGMHASLALGRPPRWSWVVPTAPHVRTPNLKQWINQLFLAQNNQNACHEDALDTFVTMV